LSLSHRREQTARRGRNVVHSLLEVGAIRPRGRAIAADFAHKLQGGGLYLVVSGKSIGLAELLNAAAHRAVLLRRFDKP
jgi:hypothetical protein